MSPQNKPQRYIVIDTNIFEYLGKDDLYSQIIEQLRDAVSKGYGISMSIFSLLELIDTATVENEAKAMTAINGIKRFQIKHSILVAAGRLGCLYKADGIDKQPEKGDKIIAATAVMNNAIIFTANGRDFPMPFFKELFKFPMIYKKGGKDVCVYAYFLEPELDVIAKKYQERVGVVSEAESKEEPKQEEQKEEPKKITSSSEKQQPS